MPVPLGEAAKAWTSGVAQRERPLERARRVAALTIPHLVPPDGLVPGDDLPDPYQSVGARGINNLASRLQLTLLPPQEPWFVYEVGPAELRSLGVDPNDEEQKRRAKEVLSEREREVVRWVNTHGVRGVMHEFLRHLLVAGTSVMRLYREEGRRPRLYRLHNFVVDRTTSGELKTLITREHVQPSDIEDEALRNLLLARAQTDEAFGGHGALFGGTDGRGSGTPLYTIVDRLPKGRWVMRQEYGQVPVPGSEVEYASEDDVPWIVTRFGAPADENYGRSLGEELLGDLRSVEGLSQALIEAAAIAAECRWAVSPQSGMTPFQLATIPNGGYIAGNGDAVTAIRLDKNADLAFAQQRLGAVEQRVELSFLLQSAIRRDAERVTAEEIRRMAEELEIALGGGFSIMGLEFQTPLTRKVDRILTKSGVLQDDLDLVDIRVVTGLEALGRSQERIRILSLVTDMQAALGPDETARRLKGNELPRRLAIAAGVSPDAILKSDEELAADSQRAQEAALLERAAPQIAQAVTQPQ